MKILTFDIEEWFHILDNNSTKTEKDWVRYESRIHQNMDRIFRILDDHDVKATFFCLGWIAKKYPNVIKRIDSQGYEIASHSNMHQLAYEMTPKEFEEDLKASIFEIENAIGKKVKSYRAPGFSIRNDNLWVFESLHRFGIENDSSVFPANRAHGGIPNFEEAKPCKIRYNGISINEYPINVAPVFGKKMIFSGGGYFRLLPYKLIKRKTNQADYVMTYFHPRDFDPNQPIISELGIVRKFKSYYGLAGCEDKLRNWLKDFDFIDLQTAGEQIDWSATRSIHIN